jgi:hypothetical protein
MRLLLGVGAQNEEMVYPRISAALIHRILPWW